MKDNLTEIVAILDMSGSMADLTNETVSGYNKFIREQKSLPGEALLSLVLFNDESNLIWNRVNLKKVPNLTLKAYRAEGMTALFDAIGSTVDDIGLKLSNTPEEERPSKVLFMIITDGMENTSKKYTKAEIAEKIKHQREKYSWDFIFLAKDLETMELAQTVNINNVALYKASSVGLDNLYDNINYYTRSVRTTGFGNFAELKENLENDTK